MLGEKTKEYNLDEALLKLDEFPIEERMEILKADIDRKKRNKLLEKDYLRLIEQHKRISWEEKHPKLNKLKNMFNGGPSIRI